jgi:hypothetical protein
LRILSIWAWLSATPATITRTGFGASVPFSSK